MNAEQRSSMVYNAVPTVFSVPNPPKRLASTRSDPPVRTAVPLKKARLTSNALLKNCTLQSNVCADVTAKAALVRNIQSKPKPSCSQDCRVPSIDGNCQGLDRSGHPAAWNTSVEQLSHAGVADGDIIQSQLTSKLNYAKKCLSRARFRSEI